MLSAKRKYSEVDDSDEEEPALGKQVLPVANLPADFAGEPQDGLEYLFTVRRDARMLPHVTRAANPYEVKEEPVDRATASLSTPHSALPSEDWREVFVSRFRNFRKNVVQPSATPGPMRPSGQKLTPEMKERDHWWAFLTGRPESEWNPPKKPKKQKPTKEQRYSSYGTMRSFTSEYEVPLQDPAALELHYTTEEGEVEQAIAVPPADSLPTPLSTPAPSEQAPNGMSTDPVSPTSSSTRVIQPEPTPSLLRHMDHRYSLHLLMYFAHWINLYLEEPAPRICTITETHARWMFALLSRVDDYLSADETSTLRSLARGCIGLVKDRLERRSSPDAGAEDTQNAAIAEASCWMVVAAVVGLWGQHDLWQDAESMLAELDSRGVDKFLS